MLTLFETVFVTAMLCFACGAFSVLVDPYRQSVVDGSFEGRMMQVGFHLIASLLYLVHWKRILLSIRKAPWLIALSGFALCSSLWSQDPEVTLRRSLVLISTALFGYYFGTRFSLVRQVQIAAWALLLVLIASAILAVAKPSMGVEEGTLLGAWRGLLGQKNELARLSVLSMLVFFFWRPSYRPLRYLALAFSFAILIKTRSATGVVVFFVLLVGLSLIPLLRRRVHFKIPLAVLLITAGVVVSISNTDFVATLLGRESTLTGRTNIWSAAFVSVMNRPILGYGFNAFWLGVRGESARIVAAVHWLVLSAHDGPLELWLELGAVGLALFFFSWLIYLRKAFRFLEGSPSELGAWPLYFLVFLFLYNLTEVTVFEPNSIFTILFCAIAAIVSRDTPVLANHRASVPTYRQTFGMNSDREERFTVSTRSPSLRFPS
jgi:exopolysaccharide production protein ExoQ